MVRVYIQFKVKAKTQYGENVHILGDGALGNWSENESIPLLTSPSSFPFWTTDRPILVPAGKTLRYRYAIYRGGRFTSWEPGGGDRSVVVPAPAKSNEKTENDTQRGKTGAAAIVTEDEFGQYVKACSVTKGLGVSTPEDLAVITNIPNTRRRLYIVAYHLPVYISWKWKVKTGVTEELELEPSKHKLEQRESQQPPITSQQSFVTSETTATPVPPTTTSKTKHVTSSTTHQREWIVTWNTDNFCSKTEDSVANDHDTTWIGAITDKVLLPSFPGDSTLITNLNEDDRISLRAALKTINCIPVFLEEDTAKKGYLGFCKMILWPTFHNSSWDLQSDWDQTAQGTYSDVWRNYQTISAVFSGVVCANINEGDCVWVHDYHLALLPKCIRQSTPKNILETLRIILFWHVPFPTSELFRTLPTRVEMVDGMLNADVVGFHSFDHARHFLTACQRLCGFAHQSKQGTLGVNVNGRNVMVSVSHIGIERKHLKQTAESEETQSLVRLYSHKKGTATSSTSSTSSTTSVASSAPSSSSSSAKRKIWIVCYEQLQRQNGITLALLAFEHLLKEYPKYRKLTRFVLRCTPVSTRQADCDQTLSEVEELISRISKKFGGDVIDFEIKSHFSMSERSALWHCSEIMIKCCIQEGLSLSPLEYIYVKSLRDGENIPSSLSTSRLSVSSTSCNGVVLLSEFCSSARMLNGALRINPWNIKSVSQMIEYSLKMSPNGGKRRRQRDFAHISSRTSSTWTRRVVADAYDNATVKLTTLDHSKTDAAGTEVSSDMKPFSEKAALESYELCAEAKRHRVFIFDYGGTLIARENRLQNIKYDFMGITRRAPSPRIIEALIVLCEDPLNHVVVISSASKALLEKNFPQSLLPRLALVAQAGLYYSLDGMVNTDNSARRRPRSSKSFRPSGRVVNERTETRSTQRLDNAPYAPPSMVSDLEGKHSVASNNNNHNMPTTTATSTASIPLLNPSSRPKSSPSDRCWHQPWSNAQRDDWESVALPIIQSYTWRTAGSQILRSATKVGWSYRQADPSLGKQNAEFLRSELEAALEQYPVTLQLASNSLHIVPKGIDKGVAVSTVMEEILNSMGNNTFPGMVVCAGDDAADESMFAALYELAGRYMDQKDTIRLFGCTVGKKPSQAEYYFNNASEVEKFLQRIAMDSKR